MSWHSTPSRAPPTACSRPCSVAPHRHHRHHRQDRHHPSTRPPSPPKRCRVSNTSSRFADHKWLASVPQGELLLYALSFSGLMYVSPLSWTPKQHARGTPFTRPRGPFAALSHHALHLRILGIFTTRRRIARRCRRCSTTPSTSFFDAPSTPTAEPSRPRTLMVLRPAAASTRPLSLQIRNEVWNYLRRSKMIFMMRVTFAPG